MLALVALVAALATWAARHPVALTPPTLTAAAPAPVLTTSVPTARRIGKGERLRIEGVSAVWTPPEPPRVARRRPARARVRVAAPDARTPAGEVDRWMLRLSGAQHNDVRVALERMSRYEPLILSVLAERGLPADLLFLALIESEFLPTATSRAGAGGIWQLMPGTARDYGLEVSSYVDERRDPIRATRAAVRHLDGLHRKFRSWHLAAAAYNAGDQRVARILREHTGARGGQEVLYWTVRPFLPRETQAYVPKLLAASRIGRAPEEFGFAGLRFAAPLAFREVLVPGGVSLAAVANAVGVPAEAVVELNPHLIRQVTPPGRRWPVRIPAEAGDGK